MDISYSGGIVVEVETTIDATALAAQHGWRLPPSGAGPASGEEAIAEDAAADADAPPTQQSAPSPRRPLGQALQERLLVRPSRARFFASVSCCQILTCLFAIAHSVALGHARGRCAAGRRRAAGAAAVRDAHPAVAGGA